MLEILSRQQAKSRNLKRYYTGKPCKHGHLAERSTSSGQCMTCHNLTRDRAVQKRYRKQWKKDNPERYAETRRKLWRRYWQKLKTEDPAKAKALCRRAGRPRNRLANVVRMQKRRALLDGRAGAYTVKDIKELIVKQKNRCAICFKKLGSKYHIDHIVPVALGGSNALENIQIAHPACNCSKGAKDPLVYANQMGRLL